MCSTPFGSPLDPEVYSTRARSSGVGAPGAHGLARVDQGRHVVGVDHEVRTEPGQQRVDLGRSGEVVDRRGDRAEAPAGPVQREGLPPVGGLPGDGARRGPTPCAAQRAGQPRRPRPASASAPRSTASSTTVARAAPSASSSVGPLGGPVLVEPGGLRASQSSESIQPGRDARPAAHDVARRRSCAGPRPCRRRCRGRGCRGRRARPGTRGSSRSRRAAGSPRRTRTWPRGWRRSWPSRSRARAGCRRRRPGARPAAAAAGRPRARSPCRRSSTAGPGARRAACRRSPARSRTGPRTRARPARRRRTSPRCRSARG